MAVVNDDDRRGPQPTMAEITKTKSSPSNLLSPPSTSSPRTGKLASPRQSPRLGARRTSGEESKSSAFNEFAGDINRSRLQKRFKTFSCDGAVRGADAVLSPGAAQELQRLHEQFIARKGEAIDKEDLSAEVLQNAWCGNAWHVISDQPHKAPEEPSHVRSLITIPSLEDGLMKLGGFNVWALCTKGRKSKTDKAIGQDNVSVSFWEDAHGTAWDVFCVLDGHGPDGHVVSNRGCRTLPYYLSSKGHCGQLLQQQQIEAALLHSFELCQKELIEHARHASPSVKIQISGSTAAVILRKEGSKSAWVAWTGDSRIMMFDEKGTVLRSSTDHKPSVPTEKARIEANGCEVRITEYPDGFIEERVVKRGEEFPAMCMTRSLGDLIVKANGVTAEPQVEEWNMSEVSSQAWIIAASDGVWEFLENDEVASILSKALSDGKSGRDALDLLWSKSREMWKLKEGLYCDDTSALLLPVSGGLKSEKADFECMGGVCKGFNGCINDAQQGITKLMNRTGQRQVDRAARRQSDKS